MTINCDSCNQEIDGVEVKLGWQEGLLPKGWPDDFNSDNGIVLTSICTDCTR
jgi:hypothetical protein